MLNFGASKPRVKGGGGLGGPSWIRTWVFLASENIGMDAVEGVGDKKHWNLSICICQPSFCDYFSMDWVVRNCASSPFVAPRLDPVLSSTSLCLLFSQVFPDPTDYQ